MDSGSLIETAKAEETVNLPEPDYSDSEECGSPETKDPHFSTGSDLDQPSEQDTSRQPAAGDLDDEQDIPVPDYPEDDVEDRTDAGQNNRIEPIKLATESLDGRLIANGDDSELIMPKKLVNPCLLSKEHKALRQELKMNHKLGKNPTEKPELIKVLKERQQKEKKKELEEHLKAKRTSFDIRLEEQASKISQAEQQGHHEAERIKQEEEKPEFFKMHSKINKAKADT